MQIQVGSLLHLLAHELRAPAAVAQGYVRLLREDRLGAQTERERALEQTQAAIARISALSHEATGLADLLDAPAGPDRLASPLAGLLDRAVLAAALDEAVTIPPTDVLVSLADAGQAAEALGTLMHAVAREANGRAPRLAIRRATTSAGAAVDLLMGDDASFEALAMGPDGPDAGAVRLDRGGLGLRLVAALVTLDAEGATLWTLASGRAVLAVRLAEDSAA